MKIVCDKDDFALLVRECQLCETQDACRGCLFSGLCSAVTKDGLTIMDGIEDICEIEG